MQENTAGIVGFGTMGRGLARTLAGAGIEVMVMDRSEEKARESLGLLEAALDQEIARWGITQSEKKAILSRIKIVERIEDLADVPFVLEAVADERELKRGVFWGLDQVCPSETILITNTSTLSVSDLAEATRRPDKVIGMHFQNPVHKMKLVEIVRGLKTSDSTMKKVMGLAEALGKTGIEVYESPGYVTTRIILPLINEAVCVVFEGVASAEDVDRSMVLGFGFDVGPLTLADRMGLDEVRRWNRHLYNETGDHKFLPCALLRKKIRENKLGVKTGEGFFKYDKMGRKIPGDKK